MVERLRALSWVEIAGVVHDDQAPVAADEVGALPVDDFSLDPARATYFDDWGNRAITFGPRVEPGLVALVGAPASLPASTTAT